MENQSISIWKDIKSLDTIKKLYAKDLLPEEFTMLVAMGVRTGCDPFLREIWAVKNGGKDNPAQIFIGRDGYRKAAQRSPDYDYHFPDAVYENDSFIVENGDVKHSYNLKERGKLVGAYCIVKRKTSSKPVFNYVELKEYDKKRSTWNGLPATMIKKVAEAQGLRMTFQEVFAGTYDETENWEKEEPKRAGMVKKDDAIVNENLMTEDDYKQEVAQNQTSFIDVEPEQPQQEEPQSDMLSKYTALVQKQF